MADGTEEFAITMRGYDRAQVDQRMEAVRRQLAEARREVAALDQRAMTLAGELADAQRRLRESDLLFLNFHRPLVSINKQFSAII